MHHGSNMDNEEHEKIWPPQTKALTLGATGEFPEGKLLPSDEGEIRFGITHKDGKVIVDFGTSVRWFGMSPGQAIELANHIKTHALLARK